MIRGSVTLDYRTTDRVVVLHLPGQPQRLFKLRLAANPGHSDQFGPWHLVDRIASPGGEAARELNDAFAIRYRVRVAVPQRGIQYARYRFNLPSGILDHPLRG